MVKRISTGSPFEQKIGYSRAVVDRDMVYVSGTTGYDYATMRMPEDAGQQARNALGTIRKALEDAGASLGDVVRVRYYLVDMSVYDAVVAAAIDGLWPETDAPLKFGAVCFVSTATGYALQNTLLMLSGTTRGERLLNGPADKFVLLYSQAAATCVFLLWFAMVSA